MGSQGSTVKTRAQKPKILQVNMTRFLYIGYLVGNEAGSYSYSRLSGISFVQIETSRLLLTVSSQYLRS